MNLKPFFENNDRKPAIIIYEQVLEHIFNLDEEIEQIKKVINREKVAIKASSYEDLKNFLLRA